MAYVIKVDTGKLNTAADRVDAERQAMARLLRGIIASPVFSYWTGEASKIYRKKLEELQGDINDVDRIFQEMINDLRAASKVYQKAETEAGAKVSVPNPNSLTF